MEKEKIIGYKAFNKDAEGLYCQPNNFKFRYKAGEVYEIEGKLSICNNGIHFCRELKNVFKFYDLVQWVSVHKVEVLGDIIDDEDNIKSCTNKLKILEEVSFKDIIQSFNLKSNGVNGSNGVNCSDGVNCSNGVNKSNGVNLSNGVNYSFGVNCSFGVNESNGVNGSNGVNCSDGVNGSNGVNLSFGVNESDGVNLSNGVNKSNGVNLSNGVNKSNGVNRSFGILNSNGVSNSLFLANKKENYFIFGKEVSEKRFKEVRSKLYELLKVWRPAFNNLKSLYLKYGSEWKLTPIQSAEEIQKKEAWADMPHEAIKYVMSLEEFDKDMFKEITDIDTDKIKE